MEGFVRASGGFMQQQLEKATNLLEQADQKAGDKISVVKERAGLQSTPARTPGGSKKAETPQISAAAASLLGAAEREAFGLSADGAPPPATPEAAADAEAGGSSDAAAADTDADDGDGLGAEAAQQRRARQAEWTALQQELQILLMHSKKLHGRLQGSAAALERSRAAEASLRAKLDAALAAQRKAEEAAAAAKGETGVQSTKYEEAAAEADGRVRAARDAAAELEAKLKAAEAEAAAAREAKAAAEAAAATQSAAAAQTNDDNAAELLSLQNELGARSEQLAVASAREAELLATNQALSAELGERSRAADGRSADAAKAEAAAAAAVAAIGKERAAREASVAAQAKLQARVEALQAEAVASHREREEAEAARGAAERELALLRAAPPPAAPAEAAVVASGAAAVVASGEAAVAEAVAAAQAASAGQAADLAKQVEGLMSERAALRFQVESEGARRRTLEKQLAQAHAATPAPSTRIDMPTTPLLETPGGGRRKGDTPRLRLCTRLLAAAAPAARTEVVRIAEGLDDVLTVVDHATLRVGRLLLHNPMARLGAAAYATLVHLWLLVVIFSVTPLAPRPLMQHDGVHGHGLADHGHHASVQVDPEHL